MQTLEDQKKVRTVAGDFFLETKVSSERRDTREREEERRKGRRAQRFSDRLRSGQDFGR